MGLSECRIAWLDPEAVDNQETHRIQKDPLHLEKTGLGCAFPGNTERDF